MHHRVAKTSSGTYIALAEENSSVYDLILTVVRWLFDYSRCVRIIDIDLFLDAREGGSNGPFVILK